MATAIPRNHVEVMAQSVAAATGGVVLRGRDKRARGVVSDTRAMAGGEAFVALRGAQQDGHVFLGEAAARGAELLVVEREGSVPDGPDVVCVSDTLTAWGDLARAHAKAWRSARADRRMIAITGSAGKTTTKQLCAALLAEVAETHATPGNLNNLVGVPAVVFALEPRHRFAVVECGMSVRGEIAALASIVHADVSIITNVSVAHAEGVGGTREDVAREKGALFDALGEDGVCVYDADDAIGRVLAARCKATRKLGFGRASDAAYRLARRVSLGLAGSRVTLERPVANGARESLELRLPFVGEAAAIDLCAALAAADAAAGVLPNDAIIRALDGVQNVAGRVALHETDSGILVIDDSYNANPASMRSALSVIYELLFPLRHDASWLRWLNVLRYVPFRIIAATSPRCSSRSSSRPGSSASCRGSRSARSSATTAPRRTRSRAARRRWAARSSSSASSSRPSSGAIRATSSSGPPPRSRRATASSATWTTTSRSSSRTPRASRSLQAPRPVRHRGGVLGYVFLARASTCRADWWDIRTRLEHPVRRVRQAPDRAPDRRLLPFAVLVVVWTSNAVNLTDGLDGLAIGPSSSTPARTSSGPTSRAPRSASPTSRSASSSRATSTSRRSRASASSRSTAGPWSAPASASSGTTRTRRRSSWGTSARSPSAAGLGMCAVFTKNELLSAILGGVFFLEAVSVMVQVARSSSPEARLSHGAHPPPLRKEGVARAEDHRPLLDRLRFCWPSWPVELEAEVRKRTIPPEWMSRALGQARRRRRARRERGRAARLCASAAGRASSATDAKPRRALDDEARSLADEGRDARARGARRGGPRRGGPRRRVARRAPACPSSTRRARGVPVMGRGRARVRCSMRTRRPSSPSAGPTERARRRRSWAHARAHGKATFTGATSASRSPTTPTSAST
jgi:UDP-N-acetylmuramoyl-tripeptide--D-alanyl-D-alanine ligase